VALQQHRHPIPRLLFSAPARRVWVVLLALLTLFTLFMALTAHPPDELSSGWDKLNHAGAFTALTFTGLFAFHGRAHMRSLLGAALFALGGLIELVQLVVPGHRGDWHDLLADTVGIAIGLALGTWVARHFERRARRRDGAAGVHSSRR
jgi:VanZ family protein